LFDKPMKEPPPAHLVEFVLKYQPSPGLKPAKAKHRQPGLFSRLFLPDAWTWGLAAAASIMIAIGATGGWFLRGALSPSAEEITDLVAFNNGTLVATGALEKALETMPSGKEVTLASSVSVKPALTFKSRYQSYCREYEIIAGSNERYEGLSCRNAQGKWEVEVNAALAYGKPRKTETIPAGSESPTAGSESLTALEATVNEMIQGDAFGREEEAAIIRNGWKN
jgi:hypothetical protein